MSLKWTVDYGAGPKDVEIPHVWHGEVPVTWEGPATYRTGVEVPTEEPWLVFHGVSYRAEIWIEGEHVVTHEGIWDAFSVDLGRWKGMVVGIEVRIIKNGGASFPVKEVASGFLPYVYHTFGGIFRSVELVEGEPVLDRPLFDHKVDIRGGRIYVNGEPFYARGILTWGWYPDGVSPHPDWATIYREIDQIESMGFNLVKFCLWLPPHEYLEELHRRGIWAWLELPIWMPATDSESLARMREEALRIVAQYRRHPNVLAWTAGCELSEGIDPEWRRRLVDGIFELTGHPLIKDNSGGAEMYGGHPAEFGSFEDFHPYCDPAFYPEVLAGLHRGPRAQKPTLLGEFNDSDVYRPIHQMVEDLPFWASSDTDLNDPGVRWQFDLPGVIERISESGLGEWVVKRNESLIALSLMQSAWMRQKAFDATRMHRDIDGWVLTGHRHTPISTSGVVDDCGELVYPLETVCEWTADLSLMLFPRRTPPWVNGGNRVGWEHPTVRFAGPCLFQVAAHSVRNTKGTLSWSVESVGSGMCDSLEIVALEPTEVGSFVVDLDPGSYTLRVKWGEAQREFCVRIVEPLDDFDLEMIQRGETISAPFFREGCLSYEHQIWEELGWVNDFERLSLVGGDSVLDSSWLDMQVPGWEPLLVRLDTRTFEVQPLVALADGQIWTSMLPTPGLGIQPYDPAKNPAAHDLIRLFRSLVS